MDEMWASVWMSVQQDKWRVPSGAHLSFLARFKGGDHQWWVQERCSYITENLEKL